VISDHTYKTTDIILLRNFIEHISCPYKPRSRDPTLIFGPLDICTVNHHPPVGLCLDSNEDRETGEHFANLDQMAIWSANWCLLVTSLWTASHWSRCWNPRVTTRQ